MPSFNMPVCLCLSLDYIAGIYRLAYKVYWRLSD